MSYQIESGVPLASRRQGAGTGIRAALRAMREGDSFVATTEQRRSIFASAYQIGVKIATRVLPEDPTKIRVWRIA